jgi:hypothetical protein
MERTNDEKSIKRPGSSWDIVPKEGGGGRGRRST